MIKRNRLFVSIVIMLTFAWNQSVYWEPEIPVPGGDITIYYNVIEGTLDNSTYPVYIHLGYNGWQETDQYAMTSQSEGWWSYTYSIPSDAETIDFVFTDLNDNWDNNGGIGIDWHISLNYYWTPFNPGPNDEIDIVLNNVSSGGSIFWSVNDGNGFDAPINFYWPNGSTTDFSDLPWEMNSVGSWVKSPLSSNGANSYHAFIGPLNAGEQIVTSIKYVIQWEDGSWDVSSNDQIIFYDIYFDYIASDEDPYIFFTSPSNGSEEDPPVDFTVLGDAQSVEFWIDGEMIGSDNSTPFNVSWTPVEGSFGDYKIAARATGSNGNISYSFLDFSLSYEINNQIVPTGVVDGLNLNGTNVVITLYAPGKDYVAIKGSWNSELTHGELMSHDNGTWWYETTLSSDEYTYQFNIEGIKNIADPWSKDVIWVDPNGGWETGYYEHALTVFEVGATPHNWGDGDFERPEQNEVVIYELHIGDFMSDGENHGTFNDVTAKIQFGYFTDLGVSAIELMPVNEFEGANSWGYNPSFYMAPETSYGTPDELKFLIDTAHQNGIAVLMDVVFDHLWGSAPLFQLYQPPNNYDWDAHDYTGCPYFQNTGSQWEWGYKLDHWKDRTRKHIDDVLYHWIDEYHIDGFRFDYTSGIGWDSGSQWGATHYANMLNTDDPTLILVAEEDNASQISNTGFDAGWDYSFHHMMFANLTGINYEGHNYGDIGDFSAHIDAYSQGYSDHTGQLIYTESHDETRIVYECTEYQNYSDEGAYDISKLGAVILMTAEGTPMLYQGQEFGQNGTSREGETIIPQPELRRRQTIILRLCQSYLYSEKPHSTERK